MRAGGPASVIRNAAAVDDERERDARRAPTASSPSSRARRSASRAGRARSIPTHPQGLFFRDTRFISELRLTLNGTPPEPLAATTTDPFSAVFVLRGHPSRGRADSHLVVFRRRYIGRGMREDIEIENFGEEAAFCSVELLIGADFADLFEVKEGRVHKQGKLGVHDGGQRAHHVHLRAQLVHPRHARRLHRRAAHLGLARALRGDRAAARPLVGVHAGDAGDRRAGDHAAPPVRPAGRAVDAGRPARGVDAAPARGDAPTTTSSARCSTARRATSPGCASSIPSSPIGRSSPRARRGS